MKDMKKSDNKLRFPLEINESMANAIRRSSNEIPIAAIDEVDIHKNDSALYDEIIAHRIGLIPLEEGRKLDTLKEGDKPSAKNQIQLALKVKGPGTVYSGDLKGDAKIIYPKMPIVILEKDQELQLVAFARTGKGKKHAKHSPGLVYYRNISEITIKDPEGSKEILEKINHKGEVKKGEVIKSNEDLDYIETLMEGNNSLEVKYGKEIVFFIESWGQRDPKEIFIGAISALNSNLKELAKVMKK